MMSKKSKKSRRLSGSPATIEKRREEKALRARQRRRRKVIIGVLIALLLVAAGGSALFALNQRDRVLYDLSEVGTGVPAVVQVHDVTCPVCTELRAQVNRVANDFEEDELLVRIADVRDPEAVRFASRYTTARRATLLYIDAEGTLVDVTSGAQSVAELRRAFQRHAADPTAE